jgi:DNA polymerase II small subunit/DNA polymerase delta subunit B
MQHPYDVYFLMRIIYFPSLKLKSALREMIQQEMEAMRDDMEEAMRNLHVDLLRQLQLQSQEYSDLISNLKQENEKLREENELLKKSRRR